MCILMHTHTYPHTPTQRFVHQVSRHRHPTVPTRTRHAHKHPQYPPHTDNTATHNQVCCNSYTARAVSRMATATTGHKLVPVHQRPRQAHTTTKATTHYIRDKSRLVNVLQLFIASTTAAPPSDRVLTVVHCGRTRTHTPDARTRAHTVSHTQCHTHGVTHTISQTNRCIPHGVAHAHTVSAQQLPKQQKL